MAARSLRGVQDLVWDSPRYPRVLLLTCLVGMFSTTFTFTVVTVAFKTVAADLHTTPSVVAWVVTAPALAIAVSLPIFGRLGDVAGHRKVYLVGFAVAIVFNLLTAAAPNVVWLIVCRTIAQLAGTATWPSSYAMLFRHFPPHQRIRATAWATGALTTASVSGLVIGGPTISAFGWRPLFVAQAVLGILAIVPALVVLKPDERTKRAPIDVPGALLLAVTLFSLTFGINRITSDGPTLLPIALLAIFPLACLTLWKVEQRTPVPLLPLRLITNRQVQLVATATFLLGLGFTGAYVITPLLLQSVFGLSVTTTSLITACRTVSVASAAPVASRWGVRFGERRLLIGASIGITAGMVALAFGSITTVLAIVIAALVITGWTNGLASPSTVAMIANAVDQEDFGLASSVQQMANQMGAVVGIGLFTAIAANSVKPRPFAVGFIIAAGLAAMIPPLVARTARPVAISTPATVEAVDIEPSPEPEPEPEVT